MFLFIINRAGSTHIIDFKNYQGKYRTLCGKNFYQHQNITTLSADNTFSGICSLCKSSYDDMYSSDLEYGIRTARSTITNHTNLPTFHYYNFLGPQEKYEPAWNRVWTKLSRAKLVIKNKNNKYVK